MVDEIDNSFNDDLHRWWGLSYASWLTIPRVLMKEMPQEWRDRMFTLLTEYYEMFPNQPDINTLVLIKRHGKYIKTPSWLINYRHPEYDEIEKLRNKNMKEEIKQTGIGWILCMLGFHKLRKKMMFSQISVTYCTRCNHYPNWR